MKRVLFRAAPDGALVDLLANAIDGSRLAALEIGFSTTPLQVYVPTHAGRSTVYHNSTLHCTRGLTTRISCRDVDETQKTARRWRDEKINRPLIQDRSS
jgi:hypothetical protein